MKNENPDRLHLDDAVFRKPEPKPKPKKSKHNRSRHKKSKRQLKDIKFRVLLIVFSTVFVALLVFILVSTLRISVIQVGLPIENGVYKISHDDKLFFDPPLEKSKFVDQYQITYDSDKEYLIQNIYSNLTLTAVFGSNNELNFELQPINNTCSQKFLMTVEEEGGRLISTCNVDVESSIWQFESIEQTAEIPASVEQTVEDGTYAFVPDFNQQGVLKSIDDSTLQIIDKDNSTSQLFEITYNDLGYYNVYSLELRAFLDVSEDSSLLMNTEQRNYCGQRWAVSWDEGVNKIISSCNGYALGALDGLNVGVTNETQEDITSWQIEKRSTMLFVGDSITAGSTNCNYNNGYCQTVSMNAVNTEMSILNQDKVNYIEVNMGNPGATTNTYLYSIDENYLSKINQYRIKVAQVMLGTNDSALGTSGASYTENISKILSELLNAGVELVILNYPIYNSVNPSLLLEYIEGLNTLANNETVFIGDTSGYEWFKQNSWHLDNSGSGFHPDQEGYSVLGEMWATAFERVLEDKTI